MNLFTLSFPHRAAGALMAFCLLAALPLVSSRAQFSRVVDTLNLHAELSGTLSHGEYSPWWMSNNRYGLASVKDNWSVMRLSAMRDIAHDRGRHWQVGWGADLAYVSGSGAHAVVQQLYADIQYKRVRLSIGAKERSNGDLNSLLSSGDLASGSNCRPMPQVRLELPEFWNIPGLNGWLAIRGHIAYGCLTDDDWQSDFVAAGGKYSQHSLYHTKAGFLRVGNEKKFPLTFTIGLEANTQFAGTAYNVSPSIPKMKMDHDLKAFWDAFTLGGHDATDLSYKPNVQGNTLGAWHFSLDYHGDGWKARAYAQHVYDDHSQLFIQYGWKDMLWGLEAELPKNPVVSNIVYEYLSTTDQTGPIYHDYTHNVKDQISAADDYYNHGLYAAWQHAGFGNCNGLLISPVYNKDHRITFRHNRIRAHHLGLMGQPLSELGYRFLFSYEKSWGTYNDPLVNPLEGWTLLAEASYKPRFLKGWGARLGYGHNGGKLFRNSNGLQFTITWDGIARL